jgi:polysaccharide pyruvyl transferase WcaK-like protein
VDRSRQRLWWKSISHCSWGGRSYNCDSLRQTRLHSFENLITMNPVRIDDAASSDGSTVTSDPTQIRIALFGMFGVGNLGNECTLQAMLHNLRRLLPNAQVCCVCEGPDETALSYKLPAFPIREMPLPPAPNRIAQLLKRIFFGPLIELYRWLKTIKRLQGSSMLVMTGTGMLSDLGILPLGLHYDILRWSIAAKLCHCKLMFVSVGVGPIRHPLSKFFVKAALRIADYRSYRDTFSQRYVEGMGISCAGDAAYPDLVFSLPTGLLPPARTRDGRGSVIGIGLITDDKRRSSTEEAETLYHDYIAKLAMFVAWLIEHKYTVRLLIGDVAYDSRARQDLKGLLEQREVTFERGQFIDEPARSIEQLLSQLEGTDIVVASRFHNVLLALMLGKPVVAISFHEKVDSLMGAMGMTGFCQNIERVDVNTLIDQFTALETNAESIKCELKRTSEAYRSVLENQYKVLFNRTAPHMNP